MKKRLFCLLLIVALMSTMGMTAFAEPDLTAEPAPQETTPDTTVNEPAPVEPASEIPAEPVPETPIEPAPETSAAPEANVPGPETTEEPTETTETEASDEPEATEEPGIMLTGLEPPAPAAIQTDKVSLEAKTAYDCWAAYNDPRLGDWRKMTSGYATVTVTAAPEANIVWHVESKVGGAGAAADGSPGTLCVYVTDAENKNILYLMGGTDLFACPYGTSYAVTVYAVVDGVKSQETTITLQNTTPDPTPTPAPTPGGEIPGGMVDKSEHVDNYEYGVWLHVVNGSFKKEGTWADKAHQASIWVDFQDKENRILPTDLPQVTRTNGDFDGWYTQAPTEEKKLCEGEYEVWSTVRTNGTKIVAGNAVPKDVQVLYAAFNDKTAVQDEDKLITFYLDSNGMGGSNGVLTCTRKWAAEGVAFTAADAAVFGVNYEGGLQDGFSWAELKTYWESHPINNYTFKGWYTDPKNGQLAEEGYTIKNGTTLYAHWSKDDQTQESYERPVDPEAGPIDGVRIDGPLSLYSDPNKGGSVTVPLAVFPVRGTGDITWTIEVPYTVMDGEKLDYKELFKPSDPKVYTISKDSSDLKDAKFTAEVHGLNLVITPTEKYSQVMYVSATVESTKGTFTTPSKATVVIKHDPAASQNVVTPATCTVDGQAEIDCTQCGVATETITLPATGHTYEKVGSEVVNGVRVFTAKCIAGDDEKIAKCGDVDSDNTVDSFDAAAMYQYVLGTSSKKPDDIVGDINEDGEIDSFDAAALYRYVLGTASTLG